MDAKHGLCSIVLIGANLSDQANTFPSKKGNQKIHKNITYLKFHNIGKLTSKPFHNS